MTTAIQSVRIYERAALAFDGKISKTEAQTLLKLATTKEAKTALKDILARDAFEDKDARKVLKKAAGKLDEKQSSLAGTTLGTYKANGVSLNVVASREISPTAGYANEFQALGAARASGLPSTAVVKDNQTPPRWHAVETNIPIGKGFNATTGGKVGSVTGMPVFSQSEWDTLKQDAQTALTQYQSTYSDADRDAALDAYVKLAAASWGVDPSRIHPMTGPKDLKEGMINLTVNISHGQAYFGNATKEGNAEPLTTDGTVRTPHGIVMGPEVFRNPTLAAGALTHEATHKEHHDLGNLVAKEYADSKSTKDFGDWMKTRKPKLTQDQREMIREQVEKTGTAQTELSSYVNELAVTFARYPATDTEAAMTLGDIKKRLGALGADDEKTLKALYDSLDEDHRKVYEQYLPKPK